MQHIKLSSTTSQRIYNNYLKRVKKCIEILSETDKEDILMELNSHIFEGMQRFSNESEADKLLIIIEKLGIPEEFLKPITAEKKIEQAIRTFNPKHIFQGLVLNLKNSLKYSIFSVLYLSLFAFVFLIAAKIIFPSQTGLFYLNGKFVALGFTSNAESMNEVLGFWFIPLSIITIVLLYTFITLFLRFTKKR